MSNISKILSVLSIIIVISILMHWISCSDKLIILSQNNIIRVVKNFKVKEKYLEIRNLDNTIDIIPIEDVDFIQTIGED